MDWILDHFQLVVVAVFVIGSLVKSVIEGRLKRGEQAEPWPETEVPLDEDKSYRKPVPDVPPPSTRAAAPPPLPRSGRDVTVAAEERARELKHQQDLAERLRHLRETKATTTGGAAATRARVEAKSAKKDSKRPPMAALPLSRRLRDPAEVRRAFVMREILDPPVGLR